MNRKFSSALLVLLFLFSCNEEKTSTESSDKVPPEKKLSARQIAINNCSGCHLFPEPEALDRETWEKYILPVMGARLGVPEGNKDRFYQEGKVVLSKKRQGSFLKNP